MNIVITMGGLGSRFRKAGYAVPKYEIDVCGKTLFEWSMMSLSSFMDEKFIFLVRAEDNARAFIDAQCEKIGIKSYEVIELDHLTKGQAETAMLALPSCKMSEPIFIYNIDTYVESGQMNPSAIKGDGFIPCFHADGDHWSFVRIGADGRAIEVREKKRISDNCSIGAYCFSSCELYKEIYDELYTKRQYTERGEQYIAPMYNELIKSNRDVFIQNIEPRFVHVLGTPEEVETFRKQELK